MGTGEGVVFAVLDVDLHEDRRALQQRAEVIQTDGAHRHGWAAAVDVLVNLGGVQSAPAHVLSEEGKGHC